MKKYYRVMLGKGSAFAEHCFAGNFIGADFGIAHDLSQKLPDEWRAFWQAIPIRPGSVLASLAVRCGRSPRASMSATRCFARTVPACTALARSSAITSTLSVRFSRIDAPSGG